MAGSTRAERGRRKREASEARAQRRTAREAEATLAAKKSPSPSSPYPHDSKTHPATKDADDFFVTSANVEEPGDLEVDDVDKPQTPEAATGISSSDDLVFPEVAENIESTGTFKEPVLEPTIAGKDTDGSVSSKQVADQEQVDEQSTAAGNSSVESTFQVARNFEIHLHYSTDHEKPKSAFQELTALQDRLGRLLSKDEYFACCAVLVDFEEYLDLGRRFRSQSRRKRGSLRRLDRTPSPLIEATTPVVSNIPITADTMLQILRQLDLQVGADVVDIGAYVQGLWCAGASQGAVLMTDALNTLRCAEAGIRISIDQKVVTVRAETLKLAQSIDWHKLLGDLALFLFRRLRGQATDFATSTFHITIVVGDGTARLTWNLLRGVWNHARALSGWAKQKVAQTIAERRAKRKRDEVEDTEEQERDYTDNNKWVKLNDHREPPNQNIDTLGFNPPREDTWFLPTNSGLTVEDHWWHGETITTSRIVASRIAIKYTSHTFEREYFHSCKTSLDELGTVTAHMSIAAGHIFDITPYQTQYQASTNGMWEVIDGVIWDVAHPRKPYRQSSANAVFAQPSSSHSLLPLLNAQETSTEAGERAMAQGSQSQWRHIASNNNLAATSSNQAIGSVTHHQPNTTNGESSASQTPTGGQALPGPSAPGFASAVWTANAAATQGFSAQPALPTGTPAFNAGPLSTQAPGSDAYVNAAPSFAFGSSQGAHALQPQGNSFPAQINAAKASAQNPAPFAGAPFNAPSSFAFGVSQGTHAQQSQYSSFSGPSNTAPTFAQTQKSGFGAPSNAPPSFAFGGSQVAQTQQPHGHSLPALNNNGPAPHQAQFPVFGPPINAPSFGSAGTQAAHVQPPHAISLGIQANTAPALGQNHAVSTPAPLLSQNGMLMAPVKQSRRGNAPTAAPPPTPAQLQARAQIDHLLRQADTMVQQYNARHAAGANMDELKALERKLITHLYRAVPLEWNTGDRGRRVSTWLSRPHQWIQRRYNGVVKRAELDVFDYSIARLNGQDGIESFAR